MFKILKILAMILISLIVIFALNNDSSLLSDSVDLGKDYIDAAKEQLEETEVKDVAKEAARAFL